MELGESLRQFYPELRDALRDASAREERDAMAMGELEAQKQNASQRMGEIEGIIKNAVDAGTVAPVRSPAFQRGFRMRVGKDLAQSAFQEALLKQLPDATKVDGRADPEQIIANTYQQVAQQIHPDDFYARYAFDDTAQGVIAGFRQRAAEGYAAEYQRAAEQKMADEGSELLFQLSQAPAGGSSVDATKYETKLTPQQEQAFQQWKQTNAPNDSGQDYDFRGAFIAGVAPDANGHWPDTFKKPNHPTFSDQSQYAKDRPDLAGSWKGELFVPPQTTDGLREAVRVHLDEVRKELPKSETNAFYVKNVIAPTIDKLVSQQKFTEARQLMDEMDRLDVTGNGGMLSQTSVAKAAFSDLRAKIERESRDADYSSYSNLKRQRELAVDSGEVDAAKALNDVRLQNGGKLIPGDRFTLIDTYRKANASDPLKVQGFANAVQREFENEDKFRANDRAISDLEVSTNSLNKEDLERGRARVEALYAAGEIPPSKRVQLIERIDKLSSLYGAIDEQDFSRFKRDLYAFTAYSGIPPSINFGDENTTKGQKSSDLWSVLPEALRQQHETQVTKYFGDTLQAEIRAIGDPNKVPMEKSAALDRATIKAREYARNLLRDLTNTKAQQDAAAKIQQQAVAIKQARAFIPSQSLWAALNSQHQEGWLSYEVTDKAPKGIKNPKTTDYTFVPRPSADLEKEIAAQKTTPQSEWDVLATPKHFWNTLRAQEAANVPTVLDMKTLAEEANATGDRTTPGAGNPQRAEIARRFYGIAKSMLGFTPQEIKSGVTKHGVAFDPAQIDYKTIPVFRSVAELEKEWNQGDFSPLFGEVGDSIDPKHKIAAQDFYKAQLAVLSSRK
jgi:hypothetical protein